MSKNIVYEDIHGSPEFPANVVFNDTNITGRYVEDFIYCHWHKQMEFIYITEGAVAFEIDMKPIEARKGEALLINGGELHTGRALNHAPCSLYAFVFDPTILSFVKNDRCEINFIKPFVEGIYKMPTLISGNLSWINNIVYHLRQIIELFEHPHIGYELQVKISIYSVFYELIKNHVYTFNEANESAFSVTQVERIKKVINHIERNFSQKICICELANLINLNTEYFQKIFKMVTGKTPVEYINLVRLRIAERLLKYSDSSVLEVALSTGFYNVSYFIRIFRQTHQCTPLEYRKRFNRFSKEDR